MKSTIYGTIELAKYGKPRRAGNTRGMAHELWRFTMQDKSTPNDNSIPDPIWDSDNRCYMVPLCGVHGQGKYALVDADDIDIVSGRRWHISMRGSRHSPYVRDGKNRYMHRVIASVTSRPEVVDHIDHNGLDNRRSNLRIVTTSMNLANQRPTKGTSRYKGVKLFRKGGGLAKPWVASIQREGDQYNLGYFRSEEEAAFAYDVAAAILFGDSAYLNCQHDPYRIDREDDQP